jgi:hypothetical protein
MALLHTDLLGLVVAVHALRDQCPPAPADADQLLAVLANVYRLAQHIRYWHRLSLALQVEVLLQAGLPFRYGDTMRAQQLAVLDEWLLLA